MMSACSCRNCPLCTETAERAKGFDLTSPHGIVRSIRALVVHSKCSAQTAEKHPAVHHHAREHMRDAIRDLRAAVEQLDDLSRRLFDSSI